MMIKNLIKRHSFLPNRSNLNVQQFLMPSSTINQPKYFFSSEQPQKDDNNPHTNLKPSLHRRIKYLNDEFQTKRANLYLKVIGQKLHMANGPLLRNLKNLNRLIYHSYRALWIQKHSESIQVILGFKNLKKYFKYIGWLLLGILAWSSLKKQNKVQISSQNISKQFEGANTLATDGLQLDQKLQQVIRNTKKVYIYKYYETLTTLHEEQQNSNLSSSTHNQNRRLVYYKIVFEDQNGHQYIAHPYFGDPKNLLKYIEMVQDKYHVTNRADIIFDPQQGYTFGDALSDTLNFIKPFIPIAITIYIFRKTDPTTFLNKIGTTAKEFKVQAMKDIKIRFKDVAGMDQAKKEITEFVDFLKNNEKYKEIGAKIPKGALLTGPPGTGKTMLAKACAGEAGVSFFYISGSEFVEIFVGLGASKVRDLFAKARQNAPSIIFIDEIDAIGKKRQNSRNEEKDSTLNQLLVEMDGFSSHETIVVLAATNRKQILDNALTRPGRFDRIVQIVLPDVKARQQIFMVHLAPLKIDPNQQMKAIAKRLAELSPGFSGADIANLCNQAAIIATRKNREYIIDKDFEQATERITAGYTKKNLLKQKTKKRVAYHEAGHAVSSWFLKGGDPLVKLTIIPRSKGSLGYAQYLPKTTYIMGRQELIDKVAIMLGGITTEEIFFGQMSSGGSDDLQKVYGLARRMVTQFGMGKETYNMTLNQESYIQKQSTFLADKMQQQVSNIVQEARKRSRQILQSKKDVIEALAQQLIQKQTINKDEILKIMGDRPDFQAIKQEIKNEDKQVTKEKPINL